MGKIAPNQRRLKNSSARPPHTHRPANPSSKGPALIPDFLLAGASADADAAGLGLGVEEGCSVGAAVGAAVGVAAGVGEGTAVGRAGRITALLGGTVVSGTGVAGKGVAAG